MCSFRDEFDQSCWLEHLGKARARIREHEVEFNKFRRLRRLREDTCDQFVAVDHRRGIRFFVALDGEVVQAAFGLDVLQEGGNKAQERPPGLRVIGLKNDELGRLRDRLFEIHHQPADIQPVESRRLQLQRLLPPHRDATVRQHRDGVDSCRVEDIALSPVGRIDHSQHIGHPPTGDAGGRRPDIGLLIRAGDDAGHRAGRWYGLRFTSERIADLQPGIIHSGIRGVIRRVGIHARAFAELHGFLRQQPQRGIRQNNQVLTGFGIRQCPGDHGSRRHTRHAEQVQCLNTVEGIQPGMCGRIAQIVGISQTGQPIVAAGECKRAARGTVCRRHTGAAQIIDRQIRRPLIIEQVETLSDTDYLALLQPYAERRFARDARGMKGFYDSALARKHSLRQDFEGFYQEVLGDPQFTFATFGKKDFGRLPQAVVDELVRDIPKLGYQGKAIPFDADMVEDQNLLVYLERVKGTRGATRTRTVMRMKIRPEQERPLLQAIQKALSAGGSVQVGSPLPEDAFYDAILQAVKTINTHLTDQQYNASKLSAARAVRKEIEKLLKANEVDVQAMARHYLDSLDLIEQAVANGRSERMPLFQQFVATRVRQSGERAPFTVTKTAVRMPKKQIAAGELTVINDTASLGDLLHTRSAKAGVQYEIDFGDGMTAVYRPWTGENVFAQRGEFEFRLPDHPEGKAIDHAMAMLEQLGIPAKLSSSEETELLYLHKQAYLALEHKLPAYRQLVADLDARGADTPTRIAAMRSYWGQKLGVPDVTKLPGYDPQGVYQLGYLDRNMRAGYRHQLRFDVSEADIRKKMAGFALKHSVTGGNDIVGLVDTMLGGNGAFVSTVEKMRVGVPVGGMSPEADMETGGATYFFTRLAKHPNTERGSEGFYFKVDMLRRMDAISYDHDAFGKVIGTYVEEHRHSSVEDWKRIYSHSGNETIFTAPAPVDDATRVKELDQENKQLKQQLLTLQKQVDELLAEKKAAANRSRAQQLLRKLERQGLKFGSDEDKDAEVSRLAELSDDAFTATEAAFERAAQTVAGRKPTEAATAEKPCEKCPDKTAEPAAAPEKPAIPPTQAETTTPPLRTDAGVRPLVVDDQKNDLEAQLKKGFRRAYQDRMVRMTGEPVGEE